MKPTTAIIGYAAAELTMITAMGLAAATACVVAGRFIEWAVVWRHVKRESA